MSNTGWYRSLWGSSSSFILHSFLDMSLVQWLMLWGTQKKTHISWTNEGMKEWPTHYLLACDFFLERYPNSPPFAGSDMLFCQQNNAFYYTLFNGVSVGVFRAWCVHFFRICLFNQSKTMVNLLTNKPKESPFLWNTPSLRCLFEKTNTLDDHFT